MVTQILDVKPVAGNLVLDGNATIHIDPSGELSGEGFILAGYNRLFSQKKTFSFKYKVDPALLESKNLKPGQTLKLGPVALRVQDIRGKRASVVLSVMSPSYTFAGTCDLDLSGPCMKVASADVEGDADGHKGLILPVRVRS